MDREQRVGIDLGPLAWASPGVRRVAREATRALVKLERPGLAIEPLEPPAGSTSRRWRHLGLPSEARRRGLDGVHAFTSGFAVWGGGWRTATVHELPWRHGETENAGAGHRLWARIGGRFAARVVTASERVARELARELPHAARRVRVVPWGVGDAFFDAAGAPPAATAMRLAHGYVLVPGGTRPKKRLADVLDAAARLSGVTVVASGPATAELARCTTRARASGTRLVHVGELGEDVWPAVVAGAGAVASLAASEGFALPVLEALAAGAAPVVPPDSVQSDVAGGHAECAEPSDPDALAAAFERAIRRGRTARDAGRVHAAAFRWERTANALADVFGELA